MKESLSQSQLDAMLSIAKELQTLESKSSSNPFAARIAPLLDSPDSKNFLIKLMDISFRSKDFKRISSFIIRLFNSSDSHDDLFSFTENILVRMYRMVGYKLPSISIPLMLKHIQDITGPVVYFFGDQKYKNHYNKRKSQGITLNINLIGEALNGETEAAARLNNYLELLNLDEVDYISVKISTIFSQLEALAHEETVEALVNKISILYNEVLKIREATGIAKFINLDMEEYRDLHLTIDAFKAALDKPEFKTLRAGIVIQAYLPDSYNEVLKLQAWAKERVKNGGAPIKIRVVKGANLEMEETEASLRDWPLATYHNKTDSDANYKKILLELLKKDSASAVNIGIASHNIFDIAFAMKIIEEEGIHQYVDFEMLEGIAGATTDEILKRGLGLILYTPTVRKEDYNNAIAYLVRRLDEGTQKGNFLREGFRLEVGTPAWKKQEEKFIEAINRIDTVQITPNRIQDRSAETPKLQSSFKNVPDTDWTVSTNRAWIKEVRARWADPTSIVGEKVPVIGDLKDTERELAVYENWAGPLPWKYEMATEVDYRQAINGTSEWQTISTQERVEILRKSAIEIEKRRGDLIGVAVTELGKTVVEVDVEVSEAIDFANFYAQSALDIENDNVAYDCTGINLVISPWNFPIAIPAGGVLASLAAGKRVILKPSRNAAACSYLICQCLWEAGVPKSALSFLPTKSPVLNPILSEGNLFDAIILTGGTDTAQFLLNRNPILNLYAETGGKNATIVTSLADRDQAIKNVVYSAFGNTGQKCSATSLLILEKELFEDPHFKQQLKDAAESKHVGKPWDFTTHIGPLAVETNDKIKHVIENTPDEQWLLKPTLTNNYILTPGIKWGINKEDFGYANELFGAVMFVMKAENLQEAVQLVNGVEYGLTSGIESLSNEEVDYWKENIEAGNLYANRATTGAIVLRQPFGGIKASCYGFGMKAGGVNYVLQFLNLNEASLDNMPAIKDDYKSAYANHFSRELDYVKIRGQHNICRYRKPKNVSVLVDKDTNPSEIELINTACLTIGVSPEFYSTDKLSLPVDFQLRTISDWNELVDKIDHNTVVRSRVKELSDDFRIALHKKHIHIYERPVHSKGRIELLNYMTEQSVSINYHRYGNLMGETPISS